jgi:hypothetical protein
MVIKKNQPAKNVWNRLVLRKPSICLKSSQKLKERPVIQKRLITNYSTDSLAFSSRFYSAQIGYCYRHGAIVQRVPSDRLNVQLCWYVPDKGSRCTADLCSARSCVELCEQSHVALLYPTHSVPLLKPLQAQSISSLTEGWTWTKHTKKIHVQLNP